MNPYYELPNLGNGFARHDLGTEQAEAGAIDGLLSVAVLRVVNGLEATLGRISLWRRRRAAVRELQSLSDRNLADIGLDRSQIAGTVEEIVETGDQPGWRRARSWHGTAPVRTESPANDNHARPLFGGQTVARAAQLRR